MPVVRRRDGHRVGNAVFSPTAFRANSWGLLRRASRCSIVWRRLAQVRHSNRFAGTAGSCALPSGIDQRYFRPSTGGLWEGTDPSMFAETSAVVPLPFPEARDAFEKALADGRLGPEMERAVRHGMAHLASGPLSGTDGMGQPLYVLHVPAVRRFPRAILLELRWAPPRPTRISVPSLEADLALAARGEHDSGLSIVACYRAFDRAFGVATPGGYDALMAGAVQQTLDAFLTEILTRIISIAKPQPPKRRDDHAPLG